MQSLCVKNACKDLIFNLQKTDDKKNSMKFAMQFEWSENQSSTSEEAQRLAKIDASEQLHKRWAQARVGNEEI